MEPKERRRTVEGQGTAMAPCGGRRAAPASAKDE